MKKLKITRKEYLTLSLLLESMNEKILIFQQPQKTGKGLKKTIRKLLLILYLYHTILNK